MPAYAKSPENWLAQKIAEAQNTGRAATKQSTEYVVNSSTEVCEAIVGAIGYDNKGNPTGLKTGTSEVWGIAIYNSGMWSKLVEGPWTNFTYGEKWEAAGTGQTPQVRQEGGTIRFRGLIKTNASYTAGETALTIPVGMRPSAECQIPTAAFNGSSNVTATLAVLTTGVCFTQSFGSNSDLYLDGLTFNLT